MRHTTRRGWTRVPRDGARIASADAPRLPRALGAGALGVLLALLLGACSDSTTADGDVSDESRTLSAQEQSSVLAQELNISDPPAVETVRFVKPEDRGPFVETCLAEQGYSATALAEVGIPVEQQQAYELASYVCLTKYPIDAAYAREWSDVQIGIQYDWTVDRVIPCLAERGYTITEVPSREVFVATWSSNSFYPFSQIPPESLSNEAVEELNRACPQIAPSEMLWG